MFAEKKRQSPTKIMLSIAAIRGPTVSGTVADPNRFHDDKSTYTGVYAKGGPTKIDHHNDINLSNMMDRSKTDVRGVKADLERVHKPSQRTLIPSQIGLEAEAQMSKDMAAMELREGGGEGGTTPFSAMLNGSSAEQAKHFTASSLEDHLYTNFCSFCDPKKAEVALHSAGFLKFCRDMKLIGKGFTSTDCDLIFQKSKSGGNYAKTITYKEFRQVAIPLVAQRRKITEAALLEVRAW